MSLRAVDEDFLISVWGCVRLCGVMGQRLVCGIGWVDEVSVHKMLEKRAEIDENKLQSGAILRYPGGKAID